MLKNNNQATDLIQKHCMAVLRLDNKLQWTYTKFTNVS